VLDATIAYLQREAQIGGYEAVTEAQRGLESVVRASVRYYNSEEEVECFLSPTREKSG
jgi:selenocysteine lyase/cysteine desulfurase